MQMQLQIRLSDAEYVTVRVELQGSDDVGPTVSPDVVAAIVTEKKLTVCTMDQLMDILGQVADALGPTTTAPSVDAAGKWDEEARALFRAGKL